MLYQLEKLNETEKELVLNAPAYITLLIAGADDDITESEIRRSLQLVHTKTYSESIDIQDIYEKIDRDFEDRLTDLIDSLPKTLQEREATILGELSKLNTILPKMDTKISSKYYQSLLSFATFIAQAAGGIVGFDKVSHREEKFVKLPMIKDPKLA
ncbi:MAG TPA: hypothetical protein DIW47_13965 [Bacteroidetes bacterium]|nr:hypothetical protein [Bacteroidota bacterium]